MQDRLDELTGVYQQDEYCPECETLLKCKKEEREGHHNEIVEYCEGCGFTRTVMV
jgi:hypothetical protein